MPDAPHPLRAKARTAAIWLVPALRRLEDERRALETEQAALRAKVSGARRKQRALQAELDRVRSIGAANEAVGSTRSEELQYVFIVTYGRSGSTLLQGILDSTPGYLIRGENSGALYRLFQYHHQLEKAKKTWLTGDTLEAKDAWYGIDEYASEAAIAGLRAVVVHTLLRPAADTRVSGFKEIRWWHDDWQQYLTFLRKLFPGARFVMNGRDHEAVSKSKWWAKNPEALSRLDLYEKQLDRIANFLGDAVYRVNFDEFVADHDVLAGLFDWLGEPFDRARIDATMAIKHSS